MWHHHAEVTKNEITNKKNLVSVSELEGDFGLEREEYKREGMYQ